MVSQSVTPFTARSSRRNEGFRCVRLACFFSTVAVLALPAGWCNAQSSPLVVSPTLARFLTLSNDQIQTLTAQHKAWRAELPTASPMRALILHHWIGWAETIAPRPLVPWIARVSVLDWAGLPIVALPGEIFAETSLFIRAKLDQRLAIIAGFSEGNPGYIPPASEFHFGGYEVDEAHRYYGMPATFASGSAEALAEAATSLFPDRSV